MVDPEIEWRGPRQFLDLAEQRRDVVGHLFIRPAGIGIPAEAVAAQLDGDDTMCLGHVVQRPAEHLGWIDAAMQQHQREPLPLAHVVNGDPVGPQVVVTEIHGL